MKKKEKKMPLMFFKLKTEDPEKIKKFIKQYKKELAKLESVK